MTDTGAGISSEVLPQIFEPFFTTKKRADGAGLGLAVSYAIIERAGGDIEVRTEPGKGTTFEISLRRSLEPTVAEESGQADGQDGLSAPAAQRTVLLIEDELPLRGLLADLLTRKGFHVLTAGDGEGAVEIAKGLSGSLDLIVSDVMLPGVSGPEAVKAIRRAGRPDVRVLYVSGYAEDRIAPGELESDLASFLSKPFKPAELVMAVNAIMSDAVAERPLT